MPRLRAVKPHAIEKRLKMFMFGEAGVGKTFASIQFPMPYLMDTERGAENDQYVKALAGVGGVYFFTTDLDEIINEVLALMTEKHEYRTLVIDPITVPYNDACERAAREIAARENKPGVDGTEFGRNKNVADRKMKRLAALLLRLDMNVILTAHAKTKWSRVGGDLKEMGRTFDGYSKLEYLFDLVVEVERRGQERVGIVRKSRIESFTDAEVFPFSYDNVAEKYGRQILERAAEAVSLATPAQVAELKHLVGVLKIDEETIEKWLKKADAEGFEELTAETAFKFIDYLRTMIDAPKPEPAPAA